MKGNTTCRQKCGVVRVVSDEGRASYRKVGRSTSAASLASHWRFLRSSFSPPLRLKKEEDEPDPEEDEEDEEEEEEEG